MPTCRRWTCWRCCSQRRSSRLFQQVRERQGLVHHVDAWTYSPGNPGLFASARLWTRTSSLPRANAILAEIEKSDVHVGFVQRGEQAVKQFTSATLSTRKTMERPGE